MAGKMCTLRDEKVLRPKSMDIHQPVQMSGSPVVAENLVENVRIATACRLLIRFCIST